mmetsp:Transcript_47698/g.119305  ORF Transcript_47698/g.119305 Transcript_47698/m.119305 type:complete len:207 (-) Transcript_47698:194-814(-)
MVMGRKSGCRFLSCSSSVAEDALALCRRAPSCRQRICLVEELLHSGGPPTQRCRWTSLVGTRRVARQERGGLGQTRGRGRGASPEDGRGPSHGSSNAGRLQHLRVFALELLGRRIRQSLPGGFSLRWLLHREALHARQSGGFVDRVSDGLGGVKQERCRCDFAPGHERGLVRSLAWMEARGGDHRIPSMRYRRVWSGALDWCSLHT